MIRYFCAFLLLTVFVCAENNFYDNWTNSYDTLLKKYVKVNRNGTTVDYRDLRNDDDFKKLVGLVGGTKGKHTRGDWARLSKDDQTAFRINFHNFLAINLIVNNPGVKTIADIETKSKKGFEDIVAGYMHRSPFTLKKAKDLAMTAGNNNIMVIFALNRGIQGDCPLRGEAYRGSQLQNQLADQFERLMQLDNGLKIDRSRKTIQVSSVFKDNESLFSDISQFLFEKKAINKRMLTFRLTFRGGAWIKNINFSHNQN